MDRFSREIERVKKALLDAFEITASIDEAIDKLMKQDKHDLVEVVRCKDCKHREQYECNHIMLGKTKCGVSDDWFCADGERRET